jgi:hypothetical protein
MQRRDPYRILGVARHADRATIEAAPVFKYHTASNGYYCPPGAYTEGERPQLNYCKTLRNVTPPKRE